MIIAIIFSNRIEMRILIAAQGREWNPWPKTGVSKCGCGKPKANKCECYFIVTSRRTRAGLNP